MSGRQLIEAYGLFTFMHDDFLKGCQHFSPCDFTFVISLNEAVTPRAKSLVLLRLILMCLKVMSEGSSINDVTLFRHFLPPPPPSRHKNPMQNNVFYSKFYKSINSHPLLKRDIISGRPLINGSERRWVDKLKSFLMFFSREIGTLLF